MQDLKIVDTNLTLTIVRPYLRPIKDMSGGGDDDDVRRQ
jgi:hypothetical protein